jgi:hypothetical protein
LYGSGSYPWRALVHSNQSNQSSICAEKSAKMLVQLLVGAGAAAGGQQKNGG